MMVVLPEAGAVVVDNMEIATREDEVKATQAMDIEVEILVVLHLGLMSLTVTVVERKK